MEIDGLSNAAIMHFFSQAANFQRCYIGFVWISVYNFVKEHTDFVKV